MTSIKDASIFLDCGAPSLYNKLSRKRQTKGVMGTHIKHRGTDDFSYVSDKEFLAYREDYIKFVKRHIGIIAVYSNLDVINNGELTWKNQRHLERAGLRPIPVYHYGTDEKWLKMYLEKGYDYIAIGGLVPNLPSTLRRGLDKLWGDLLTDADGMPLVKVHGFAVASNELLFRYPWYSCDSTSWVKFGMYGVILVPHGFFSDRIRYDVSPIKVSVTPRSKGRGRGSILNYSMMARKKLERYIKSLGYKLGKSTFDDEGKEQVIEKGLCNSEPLRNEFNFEYYKRVEEAIPKWPWKFKKGKKGFDI